MGVEIERKFLVKGEQWKNLADPVVYRQGYLCQDKDRTVRVRIAGSRGYLTVKGKNNGIERLEFEYEIPLHDADQLLHLASKPLIEKTRRKIPFGGFVWEVDEFFGENEGLVVAEIELPNADTSFQKPTWIGQEVSDDPRYYNSNLAVNPWRNWKNANK